MNICGCFAFVSFFSVDLFFKAAAPSPEVSLAFKKHQANQQKKRDAMKRRLAESLEARKAASKAKPLRSQRLTWILMTFDAAQAIRTLGLQGMQCIIIKRRVTPCRD